MKRVSKCISFAILCLLINRSYADQWINIGQHKELVANLQIKPMAKMPASPFSFAANQIRNNPLGGIPINDDIKVQPTLILKNHIINQNNSIKARLIKQPVSKTASLTEYYNSPLF